jgi:hypothetical protein
VGAAGISFPNLLKTKEEKAAPVALAARDAIFFRSFLFPYRHHRRTAEWSWAANITITDDATASLAAIIYVHGHCLGSVTNSMSKMKLRGQDNYICTTHHEGQKKKLMGEAPQCTKVPLL